MLLPKGEFLGCAGRHLAFPGGSLWMTRYAGGEAQPWHAHPNPTFFVLLRGRHIDDTPKGQVDQHALTINYHPAAWPHRALVGESGMIGLNIEMDASGTSEVVAGLTTEGQIESDASLACLAAHLLVALSGDPPDSALLETLVLDLLVPFCEPSPLEPRGPAWLTRCETYLAAEFARGASLRSAANSVGVHPVHLARTFRLYHGSTVTCRLLELRMAAALRMMLEGMSAGEAALEAGFTDQFYMSRCFSRRLKMRPWDFIRAARAVA